MEMGPKEARLTDCSDAFHFPDIGIQFSKPQFHFLNNYFAVMETQCNHALNSYFETMSPSGEGPDLLEMDAPGTIEATMERLVQRIACTIGVKDSRFASKFVLSTGSTYEHYKVNNPDEYDFMLRLDAISSPTLYKELKTASLEIEEGGNIPGGFARVKFINHNSNDNDWKEFITEDGYIIPGKVRQHFLKLVKQAIREPPMTMNTIDERRLAGASGKVVDIGVLADILRMDPKEQVFIGIGDPQQDIFPVPRSFSIKASEDGPAVKLDILIPDSEAEPKEHKVSVDLTLGINFEGWPSSCDFPDRVAHDHNDYINFVRAASKGFYLVPTGPHESVDCERSELLWRISQSTAEMELLTHYAHNSVPAMVLRTLKIIMGLHTKPEEFKSVQGLFDKLISKNEAPSLKVVSSYVLKTLFLFELEDFPDVNQWMRCCVGERVLSILRRLVNALRKGYMRSYFFSGQNIILRKGFTPRECLEDADMMASYISELYQMSLLGIDQNMIPNKEFQSSIEIEKRLLVLWEQQLQQNKSVGVPHVFPCTSEHLRFTETQLQYATLLFRELGKSLEYRKRLAKGKNCSDLLQRSIKLLSSKSKRRKSGEDMSRTLAVVGYILENLSQSEQSKNSQTSNKMPVAPFRSTVTSKLLSTAIAQELEAAVEASDWSAGKMGTRVISILARLLDGLRRGRKKKLFHSKDKTESTRAEDAKVLQNYLKRLEEASEKNGWFVDETVTRFDPKELHSIVNLSRAVVSGKLHPQMGIEEAVSKREDWAIAIAKIASVVGEVKLVFTPSSEQTLAYTIHAFDMDNSDSAYGSAGSVGSASIDQLPNQLDMLTTGGYAPCDGPTPKTIHCKLQCDNPLRAVLDQTRRYGYQRGIGNITTSLCKMNKIDGVLGDVMTLVSALDSTYM